MAETPIWPAGFDPLAVSWRSPEQLPSKLCAYCDATLPQRLDVVRLSNADGWTAQFCDVCMGRWWPGVTSVSTD